jgi:hypothetical protein
MMTKAMLRRLLIAIAALAVSAFMAAEMSAPASAAVFPSGPHAEDTP